MKSKSPQSCSAFYVQKQVELERGTPGLAINYKPLNDALRRTKYPIRNKTTFVVPFGHYEWNVMSFGLKNEIFNQLSDFIINFIVDALKYIFQSTVKTLPCFGLETFEIVKTDASDIGYGMILKQTIGNLELLVRYTSGIWNTTQPIHNTIKKEILSIILCISKIQNDFLNQEFLLRIDYKFAKSVLQKDVKNIASKHIFAYWKAILINFDFRIKYIKRENNFSIPDFLTHDFCRIHKIMTPKKNTQAPKPTETQSSKTSKELSPHKMFWSQQVELEEETRLHSSNYMLNKMLSLYYDPLDPFKPVKTTQHPAIIGPQTFKQVTKANPSQKELASSSSFPNKQIVVVANPTPLYAKSRYW